MGRPRGMRNTAMVNGRITAEQMEWLQARADDLGGNLSAALRQTISDARLLEMARDSYRDLKKLTGSRLPNLPSGESSIAALVLESKLIEVEDAELREQEARGDHAD